MIRPTISRLLTRLDWRCNSSAPRVANQPTRASNRAKPPPRKASTTVSARRIRCTQAVTSSPARVEQLVAIRMGMNTAAGSLAPNWARYSRMVTGNRVTAEVLSTRNRICASLATRGSGFRVCRSFMALMPSGVAALSRPRMFADRFRVMDEIAGWPAGTPGISRVNSGDRALASLSIRPLASPMATMPSHRAIRPTRPIARSTDSPAMSNSAVTMRWNTAASPRPSHW